MTAAQDLTDEQIITLVRDQCLTGEQLVTLRQALADAIEYRTPYGDCAECDTRPEGLCNDHAADLDLTDAYIGLARELSIGVNR